jgi:lysophospholipase L1-like esterase
MFKKFVFIILTFFIVLSLLNIFSGIVLWRLHKNYQPKKGHKDAPYIYFEQEPNGPYTNGFEIDSAIPLNKADNEYRILILGGSVANGLGSALAREKDFENSFIRKGYLEKLLQDSLKERKVTVLNGAIASFVTEQEFIAFQKFLQFYNPDMVIGLHGYNDIESFRVTHHDLNERFAPQPMFYVSGMVSPPFKMVENFKKNYSFGNIFSGYYSHLRNALFFSLKKTGVTEYPFEKTDNLTDDRLQTYANQHFFVCKDLYDFCKVKNIEYLNFLQPVRYYKPNDSTYYGNDKSKVFPFLTKIYYYMEKRLDSLPHNVNLTGLDQKSLDYIDDCHPSDEGFRFLAEAIVPVVLKKINDPVKN